MIPVAKLRALAGPTKGLAMALESLTDRELTLLLGHSLFLGHALKTAARAEQRARLRVPAHGLRGLEYGLSAMRCGRAWDRSRAVFGGHSQGWRDGVIRHLGYHRLSESARATMHVPRRGMTPDRE